MTRRVLHLCYNSGGGAGRAASRAHEAGQHAGLESTFGFVNREAKEDKGLLLSASVPDTPLEQSLWKLFSHNLQWDYAYLNRTKVSNTLFSVPYPGYDLLKSPFVVSCDIIHLHWASWLASPAAVKGWLDAGKKVVWTLHDFAPMTGGCHYPADCTQFETNCWKCPQIRDPWEIVPNFFAEKLDTYAGHPGLTIVSPSNWLAERARASSILGKCRIEVIRNPIDIDVFRPSPDRAALRAAMGIGATDMLMYFGNNDNREQRKGGAILLEALNLFAANYPRIASEYGLGRLVLAEFGKSSTALGLDGIEHIYLGDIATEKDMAELLSLADVYLHPALEDNYPNTILESMACGTPVIGFPIGGVPDRVQHRETGLVAAKVASSEAFADKLEEFATEWFNQQSMRDEARKRVVAENSYDVIGDHLKELYGDLVPKSLSADLAAVSRGMAPPLKEIVVPPTYALGEAAKRFPTGVAIGKSIEKLYNHYTTEPLDFAKLEAKLAGPASLRQTSLNEQLSVLAIRGDHSHLSARSGGHQFLRHVREKGVKVTEILIPIGDELAPDDIIGVKGVMDLVGARGFARQGNALAAELAVLREIKSGRHDIVHYIEADINGWIVPSLSRRLEGARQPPFIATLHQPPNVLRDLISCKRLQAFDSIIALCEEQREFIAGLRGEDAVNIIPHGIDVHYFKPRSAYAAPRKPDEPLKLLSIGRWLRDYKTLFETLRILEEQGLNFVADAVANVAEPHGLKNLTIHTDITDEALLALYQDADILVMPVEDATANNGILEAMACGLPIISTDIGGVPDCVGADNAILAAPKDAAGIAMAVLELAASPKKRASMGHASRRRAEKLAWSIIGEAHIDLYRALKAANAKAVAVHAK